MTDAHTKAVAVVERVQLPERMHPMVRAMMSQSPDPATLRDLLAVQREWEAGEAKREYTRALVDLKAVMPTVIDRDKSVSFGNTHYTHASLGNVIAIVTPHLAAHGFSVSWSPSTSDKMVTVTCKLTHSGGHSEETSPISAPIDNKGSKSEAQGVASTITLLQRYSLTALLGIATADMEEPHGPSVGPDPEKIDTAANLKTAGALQKHGKSTHEAVALVGREVRDWTLADLERIRAWATATQAIVPPQDQATLTELDDVLLQAKSKTELDAVAKSATEKLSDGGKLQAREIYKRHAARIAGAA